jgi:hypothetical protein
MELFAQPAQWISLRREPLGSALGEDTLFAESFALTEGYFYQILFKNSKRIQNFAKS